MQLKDAFLKANRSSFEGAFVMRIGISSAAFGTALLFATSALADIVDFENLTGPPDFASAGPTQTLIYGPFSDGVTATFAGGVILTHESSQTTDFTSVYATASFGDPSLKNPLTVTFNQSIQNFQIDILNAIAGNYQMFDNNGHSVSFSLATTGGSLATEGFAAAGTMVSILFLGPSFGTTTFDFAIDNVTFNQPLSSVPLPAALPLFATGLVGLGLLGWRRKRVAPG